MTWRLVIFAAFLLALYAGAAASPAPRAQGCAHSTAPTAYEAERSRTPYLRGLELAGYNMIRPSDNFFGTPNIEIGPRNNRRTASEPYIPPIVLKATGYVESAITQAASSVPFGAVGPALISFDCGHGIMQVTSGMTSGQDGGWPSKNQTLVATHYLFNIGRGAAILADKWNAAPGFRPIAGTDTDSDPKIVENWYFALWGYNGFTGPGANRSNHPSDPIYAAWPRTPFSCNPNDSNGHSYGNYPYQEIVYGCASRPPSVDGQTLWTAPAVPFALPDLNNEKWGDPLSLDNWTACAGGNFNCGPMDIPSPRPWHYDQTPRPSNDLAAYLLGSPQLSVSRATLDVGSNTITISNIGQGILSWRAKPGQSWVTVNKQGGVAISNDVPCADGAPCTRSPSLTINVGSGHNTGWVDIESLTTGQTIRVTLANNIYDVNCDGHTNPIDATFILQYHAALITVLPCPDNADVNGDGRIDPLDATLLLQYNAGLIGVLSGPAAP